jgi:hypothetical protein
MTELSLGIRYNDEFVKDKATGTSFLQRTHLMLSRLPRPPRLMSAVVLSKDSADICAASAAGVPGSERLPAPGGASASGHDTSAGRWCNASGIHAVTDDHSYVFGRTARHLHLY